VDYIKSIFKVSSNEDFVKDVLSAELAEIGYESFETETDNLIAYCPINQFDKENVLNLLQEFPFETSISVAHEEMKAQNWNEEWEKNFFSPIIVENRCVIHSSFHTEIPQLEYNILIDPRMSFGTGHHSTTSLMIASMLEMNMQNKNMLDMGCGTAVLAILAKKMGAKSVVGIDIDEWAYKNALDNIQLNDCQEIDIRMGGVEQLTENDSFDVIFANINRNILLNDMEKYVNVLTTNGHLFMSGFYENDIEMIRQKAETLGLQFVSYKEKSTWVAVQFEKK
jgi:ribosomal protein L11 methyltransferase